MLQTTPELPLSAQRPTSTTHPSTSPNDHTYIIVGLGSIRWVFSCSLLKLLGEPSAYWLNWSAQWAQLCPQRWVTSTGGIHPEGKLRSEPSDMKQNLVQYGTETAHILDVNYI